MRTSIKPQAITTGEPAGIGPEVSVKAAWKSPSPVILVGDRDMLLAEARRLGLPEPPAQVSIHHVPLAETPVPGKLSLKNAAYVIETLAAAHRLCANGTAGAVVTAPVQKSILIEAGFRFTGHTEFFAEAAGVPRVVMMLVSSPRRDALKVALATTHLPLRSVPDAITPALLDEVLSILKRELQVSYVIPHPTIAVAGLNPHAGENGHMGTEEITVISPALERARDGSADIIGPLPADTIFVPGKMEKWDAVLCMYHDQGLPTLKHVGFSEGVNVTLGLPYVRTSVDHGTALDIAGRGIADARSMTAALELAHTLAKNRDSRMA